VQNAGKDTLYYAHTDYQGSLTALSFPDGTVKERYAYDPWGNRRNPADWTQRDSRTAFILNRGYTLHEHLPEFNLINMNGRVYDPLTSMFMSPDPYVQAPGNWLNYNRYSYCLNNPMKYTDPSGEFLGLFMRGLSFIGDALSNWINGYSNPVGSAWKSSGNVVSSMSACLQIPVYRGGGTIITAGLDPFAFGVSENVIHQSGNATVSTGFGIGLLSGPFANFGASYTAGNWNFGGGIGAGTNYWGWNASATVNGWGAGYGRTYYGNAVGPDGQSNAQTVGSITAFWRGGSFTLQNDVKALSGVRADRWRTNGFELTIGDFSFGNTIYTNDGEAVSKAFDSENPIDYDARSPIYGKNSHTDKGAWKIGKVYSAPSWIGYRIGNQISRIGYSHQFFQDLFQNGIHTTFIGNQNYYLDYSDFNRGMYFHSGYYNPYSLWGH